MNYCYYVKVIHVICPHLQVVVQHVNIQGLGRTKEDLLGYEISDVFHAKNLIDVCLFLYLFCMLGHSCLIRFRR